MKEDQPNQQERLEPERLGLLGLASFLLYSCSDIWSRVGPAFSNPWLVLLAPWFCLLFGLALGGGALASQRPRNWQNFGFALIFINQWLLFGVFAANFIGHVAPSDTVAFSLYAANLTLLGVNPYGYPMADAFSAIAANAQSMTPLMDGGVVDLLIYPPLHFWVMLPTAWWGLEGVRWVYNAFYCALLALLFFRTHPKYRSLVLLVLLVNPEFSRYPLSWSSDSVWVFLMACMIVFWKKPTKRSVFFGLACAYKQIPWFFGPYLLVRVWQEEGRKKALSFTFISVLTFSAINLPYAVLDFKAWFTSLFHPLTSAMVPYGRGWSMLTQTGILPYSREYYSGLLLVLLLGSLWAYWSNFQRLRPILWVLPCILFFFGSRSLQHYFIYSIPLLVLDWSSFENTKVALPKWQLRPFLLTLVGILALCVWYYPGSQKVSLRVLSAGPNALEVTRINLEVTNGKDTSIRPRFFARPDWHVYPWTIVNGPLELAPGQKATYEISTDLRFAALTSRVGGEVLVADTLAPGRYWGAVTLPAEVALRKPRWVENPPSSFWHSTGQVEFREGVVALKGQAEGGVSEISRSLVFPEKPIKLKVFRPKQISAAAAFSLDIQGEAGSERVTFYFADTVSQGFFHPKHYYKTFAIAKGTWTEVELDLNAVFFEAGFAKPNLTRQVHQDAELLNRFIRLSLTFSSNQISEVVQLKDIQVPDWPALGQVAENLNHPEEYQALFADLAVKRRDFTAALEHYKRAGAFRPKRTISPLPPFFVILKDLRLPASDPGEVSLSLFLEAQTPLEFVFDPPSACALVVGEQKLSLDIGQSWSPRETSLFQITVKPNNPGTLTNLVIK